MLVLRTSNLEGATTRPIVIIESLILLFDLLFVTVNVWLHSSVGRASHRFYNAVSLFFGHANRVHCRCCCC